MSLVQKGARHYTAADANAGELKAWSADKTSGASDAPKPAGGGISLRSMVKVSVAAVRWTLNLRKKTRQTSQAALRTLEEALEAASASESDAAQAKLIDSAAAYARALEEEVRIALYLTQGVRGRQVA